MEHFAFIEAKEAVIIIGSCISSVVGTLAVTKWLRKEPTDIRVPDQPLRTREEDRFVTEAACEHMHANFTKEHDEHTRRLNGHDAELSRLWSELATRDKETGRRFDEIIKALWEIKGRLGIKAGNGET